MKRFLKQWLRSQSKMLLRIYVPVIITVLYGMFKFYLYPDSGMLSVGIVYLCAYIFVVYQCRKL
ncbi:putative membrane protein YGL010W [Kluyvera sp. 1366]